MRTFDERLGILGGGQLGVMMLQAARTLNLTCGILDSDLDAPCRIATHDFHQGSLLEPEDILRFGRQFDRITTEFEHINCDALAQLESEGKIVAPSSRCIRLIQDKGHQKEFYKSKGFPSPDFRLISSRDDLRDHTDFFPAIQKLRRMGYDGKGVYKLRSVSDIDGAFDGPSLIEDWIDIAMELSVIVCRTQSGDIQTFQPVELIADPEAHLLRYLISPARIDPKLAAQAVEIASDLANELGLVGLLAVEFMVSQSGKLLINECAPRPHNSGHHTIESCAHSQFEQHLRAVMGFPLGINKSERPAVMVNLLGKSGHFGPAQYTDCDRWFAHPNVFVHLYGKKQTKSF
ncbi:5-(carboxyamino)imidazole ribonucleotide synthase, partial [bacterium]|nr:5-(carboxyamino)imidazole ribonucleotide synthase [bacterium]